ncbi:MAG: M48 family metalloprotease [Vicinamibacterales bacterium]
MSHLPILSLVVLAAYAVSTTAFSAAAALVWRAGLIERDHPSAGARAKRLARLRAFPCVAGVIVTTVIITPSFLTHEPPRASEEVGPLLFALAALGAALLVSAFVIAGRAALATWQLERAWLRSASAIELTPPAGIPAYAVDTPAPIVALIGVFRPKLIAARSVINVCSEQELRRIVAHECGHLRARDNLKRWLMVSAPDVLRWTAPHREIGAVWSDAAEDAADDAATSGDARARADLAALLVKIAGLAAPTTLTVATLSPFVAHDGLARRVRRLLDDDAQPVRSVWPVVARVACLFATVLVLAFLTSAGALKSVHEVVETVVAWRA